jgi:hypothetical protein
MTRSFETLRFYVAAAIVLTTLAGLGIDLTLTAYAAAHTAQTVVLAS